MILTSFIWYILELVIQGEVLQRASHHVEGNKIAGIYRALINRSKPKQIQACQRVEYIEKTTHFDEFTHLSELETFQGLCRSLD